MHRPGAHEPQPTEFSGHILPWPPPRPKAEAVGHLSFVAFGCNHFRFHGLLTSDGTAGFGSRIGSRAVLHLRGFYYVAQQALRLPRVGVMTMDIRSYRIELGRLTVVKHVRPGLIGPVVLLAGLGVWLWSGYPGNPAK